jgi:hypothetical protein
MPVFGSDSTVIKEGWLWKQGNFKRIKSIKHFYPLGGRVRNWKRRWFVITDGCLFYFESRTVNHFDYNRNTRVEIDYLRKLIVLVVLFHLLMLVFEKLMMIVQNNFVLNFFHLQAIKLKQVNQHQVKLENGLMVNLQNKFSKTKETCFVVYFRSSYSLSYVSLI